ncbi:MAG: M28 family metallopeptidase [Gemmatimonadota bacterium]|nr:M28 family metallopeptidase [Gemmatimonadota bacterium]
MPSGIHSSRARRSAAALVFLASCQPCAVGAQTRAGELAEAVKAAVTAGALDRHSLEITRHERPSGSPGENAAVDYVVSVLTAAGVPVDVHEFMAYTSNPVSASVTVPGTDFAPAAITLAFSGATAGVEAALVDVGTLDDLPGLEVGTDERLDPLPAAGLEHVRGRVALVTGQPRNVPTTVLESLGAAAVIFVNPEERLNDLIVTSTWGTPSLRSGHRLPTLPVAQIRRSDGDRLRAMLRDGPVTVRVTTEVDTGWKPLRLAVARVEPEGSAGAPYALLGGHIDAWYHGGTDEGASNAAMLELALAFHAHRDLMRRGLVVAWWPGHSNARYAGSTWFADHYFEELRQRGVAYVNVDGIGQSGARRFGAVTSPGLAGLARTVIAAGAGIEVEAGRPGRNSDQSFNGVGLPLLQINHSRLAEDGGYWWWHTPDDTYDKIDVDVLKVDTDLYADALGELVGAEVLPVDLVAEAEAMIQALRWRESLSGGALDLSEAVAEAERLASAARRVEAKRGRGAGWAEADRMLLRALRPIHRVMFVPGSNHHPDPGIHGRPLPGLEPVSILTDEDAGSDRYGFAMASLVRERNRILEAVREATVEVSRLLQLLEMAS